jgi:hypothetical protein
MTAGSTLDVRLWRCVGDCEYEASWLEGESASIDLSREWQQEVGWFRDLAPGVMYAVDVEASGSGCLTGYVFDVGHG